VLVKGAAQIALSAVDDQPVVGQGRYMMNSREDIRQAYNDYQSGAMGRLERQVTPGAAGDAEVDDE
jgi:hypothetical protein